MAIHRVQGPDGKIHRIEGPADASPEQILAVVQQNLAGSTTQAGFGQSFMEGATSAGSLPAALGFGLKGDDASRQALIQSQQSDGVRTSWEDVNDLPSFWNWAKQTAGQSAGYVAAPGAAAGLTSLLTKAPGAAKIAGYGLLGAQYLTDNLGRQAGEGSPADIGKAAIASAGQTALDAVGMHYFAPIFTRMPFVKALLGKEAGAAEGVLSDAFAKGTVKYSEGVAKGVGKGIAFEVPQEIAQQALERWSAGLSLSDDDARREYTEAMAGAALLGGTMGGVGGALDVRSTKAEEAQKERDLVADIERRKAEQRAANQMAAQAEVTKQAEAAAAAPATASPAAPMAPAAPGAAVPTAQEAKAEHAAAIAAQALKEAQAQAKKEKIADPSAVTSEAEINEDGIPMGETKPRGEPVPTAGKPSPENALRLLWENADTEGRVPGAGLVKLLQTGLNISNGQAFRLKEGLEKSNLMAVDPTTRVRTLNPATKPTTSVTTKETNNEVLPDGAPVVLSDPTQPNVGTNVASDVVPASAAAPKGSAADATQSVGVAVGSAPSDQSAEGEKQDKPALTSAKKPKAKPKAKVEPKVQAPETVLPAGPSITGGVDTNLLSDEERTRLEQSPNVAKKWRTPMAKPAPAEVTLDDDTAQFLQQVEETRKRVPEKRAEALLHRNLLDTLSKNIKQGRPVTDRDRINVERIAEKYSPTAPVARERLEPGKPDSTIREILQRPDRSKETFETTDREGNTVKRNYPRKIEELLDHIIGTNPKSALAAIAKQIKDVVDIDMTEEGKVYPEQVERVRELRKQGQPLNTSWEADKFRKTRGKERYADPYLDVSLKTGEYRGERDRGFEKFKFKVVIEGQEKNDQERTAIAKLKQQGHPAMYKSRTNTFYFTQGGMDAKTVTHELLHAYTVGTLYRYQTAPETLSAEQKTAVRKVVEVMRAASATSLKQRFPEAFENVYEFVSYAMTEPQMQAELKKLNVTPYFTRALGDTRPIGELKKKFRAQTLWSALTRAIARLVGFRTLKEEGAAADFEGNAMIELAEAVSDIMTVPEGIRTEKGKARAPNLYKTDGPRFKASNNVDLTMDELVRHDVEKSIEEHDRTRSITDEVKFIASPTGWEKLITRFQNDRRAAKILQDGIELAGRLKSTGLDKNNLYDALTLSSQVAHYAMTKFLFHPMDAVNRTALAYAQARGVNVRTALAELNAYLMVMHEPERRHTKYLLNAPLEQNTPFKLRTGIPELDAEARTASAHRKFIRQNMIADGVGMKNATETQLRSVLESLVANHRDTLGESPIAFTATQRSDPSVLDETSEFYSVVGYTPATLENIRKDYEAKYAKHGAEIDAMRAAMRELQDATKELSKQSNYWSEPVERVQKFYGWENYVPFKGKPEYDEEFERFGHKGGGGYEYVENQEAFGGRQSESENAILQSMVDGARAALRYGRKDVPLTIKNLIEQGYLNGKTAKKKDGKEDPKRIIKFSDRYTGNEDPELLKGENNVFLYRPDGTIEVLQIGPDLRSRAVREAVRRTYREPAPFFNFMNQVTGAMGHMHTRYNPAFAPYNFVRDMLTNAFNMSAKLGGGVAADYVKRMTKQVVTGGMGTARKVAWLYANGRVAEIERLAKTNAFARDIHEYLETGGRVAYIQGISSKGQLDQLIKDAGESELQRRYNVFTKYVDTWSDLFELTGRASAYSTFKAQYMADGMSEADAKVKAAADAKNLANFEQIGTRGREAGAFFMFFRPAATGAVAALDAIRPLLVSKEKYLETLPEKLLKEDKATIEKTYEEHRLHARNTLLVLAGTGMALYTMALLAGQAAGDEDEYPLSDKRNPVATDDPAVWTRNLRLPMRLFGLDSTNFLQLPWGFGLGAFMSAGAQTMFLLTGKQSLGDWMGNTFNIALDSLVPLPVSRINPTDNPSGWFLDSIAPSIVRPFFEYEMNLDGLGREIYNDRTTKYGDAMLGGQNVPEGYKSLAQYLSEVTNGGIDVQPSSLYFWANNYVDGFARTLQMLNSASLTMGGEKDYDAKTDFAFVSSFVGRKGNIDAREYASVENQIKEMDKRLKMFENNPEQLGRYLKRNPNAPMLVDFYNKYTNRDLKEVRKALNEVRADKSLTVRQRKEYSDALNLVQNYRKRLALDYLAQHGVTP